MSLLQGTKIQATIFGKDIDAFEDKLIVLKSYSISNTIKCYSMTIEEVNKIVDNNFQWTINNYTSIDEII